VRGKELVDGAATTKKVSWGACPGRSRLVGGRGGGLAGVLEGGEVAGRCSSRPTGAINSPQQHFSAPDAGVKREAQ